MPSGTHLLPTVIALWNRLKGGIDVFSRHLKNLQSKHAKLKPLGAVWLRLLMSLVYNAHQSSLNFQAHSFLMDETQCTSYKSFCKKKASFGSFADFCRDALNGLELRVASSTSDSGIESDRMGPALVQTNADCDRIQYRKRESYFTAPDLQQRRLNQAIQHGIDVVSNGLQQTCVMCCQKPHDQAQGRHCRLGFITRYRCGTCKVPLCRVARSGGRYMLQDVPRVEDNQ